MRDIKWNDYVKLDQIYLTRTHKMLKIADIAKLELAKFSAAITKCCLIDVFITETYFTSKSTFTVPVVLHQSIISFLLLTQRSWQQFFIFHGTAKL